MRNVLVTGGAGFIGSNFIRYLLRTEPDVNIVNLDALTYAGCLDNLDDLPAPERYSLVRGSITDAALVSGIMRTHRIDTVVHFAAESHVDRSIHGPGPFVETNVNGTFTLIESAREVWLLEKTLPQDSARFHHVSTDEVYGSLAPGEAAWTEDSPYAPRSPYSASKASADHLVRAFGHTYGLPYTITNCSNNYGPYQFPEKLVPLVILNALDGKTIPVYGDGGHVRDWIYVEDHCEAIHLVLTGGEPGETYNIGGGNQPTNLELVRLLCGILDRLVPESPYLPHAGLIAFWDGGRGVSLRRGSKRRWPGTSTTDPGSTRSGTAPDTAIGSKNSTPARSRNEGNHSGGGAQYAALSRHDRCEQTAPARIRQADGLLSPLHADACRDP